ncbi:receptor-type tyrosine-protein phosphatase H-like isoform X3 [Ostrea edulis]|uniref:receptor-type tyrosine-protein phosphatase H-like isoform X3 n=1 Tax=Ostrea edulis TaxID=37623 RepID=UPI0024AED9AE|nr:receptor-type tyrosine-protein phosphatase H-like isoform X3 [Ostrea edulis]
MARLHRLFFLVIFYGVVPRLNCETTTEVGDFKVTITVESVTETSLLISWMNGLDYSGVHVYYTITFNDSVVSNVSSPHLIKNLTDGEIHSVMITSNIRGRDMRLSAVNSNLEYVRTAPRKPIINESIPYKAPNVSLTWTLQNDKAEKFYVSLTGPGVSIAYETTYNNITLTSLKPGTKYRLTVIQDTGVPYPSNSSTAVLDFRTTTTEPYPPQHVEVVGVGQHNISLNITDTDMPNGDIIKYIFKLRYKIYSDDVNDMKNEIAINKKDSNIYVLDNLKPGVAYSINVFTENDKYNSSGSFNSTTGQVKTLPDVPGRVKTLSAAEKTNSSGTIHWGRPVTPNGDILGYRAVLERGPNITQCRIYFLCIGFCNSTLFGPPNDTCIIKNDTALLENQKEMNLSIKDLRLGTTYTVHVVGYTKVGPGRSPVGINLTTVSIRPALVENGSIHVTFPNNNYFNVTWTPPPFPGEDLKYFVVLRDALQGRVIQSLFVKVPFYYPDFTTRNELSNYYNYNISIRPRTSAGDAYGITLRAFTTPPRGRLGRPQKLKIKISDCDKIQIDWEEADVKSRNGPITGYKFENVNAGHSWNFMVPNPMFWSLTNRKFSFSINVAEKTQYEIRMYAESTISRQTGTTLSSRMFTTGECPKDNTVQIVLIVIAFLFLLGICLAVIVFVYRKKVREIEEVYVNPNRPRPIPVENNINTLVEEDIQLERPFILSDAHKVFEEKSADSNRHFLIEYDDIKKLSQIEAKKQTTNTANIDGNKAKNRYVNILSYDHSRVKLHLIDDDPCSDYINANFIVGYTYEREYIASQGPLPGTVNDFWRMAWEQSVTIVVMLTKCKEGNTSRNDGVEDKCEHYWPDTSNEPKQYGDIVVNLISVSNMDKFDINIFQVSQGDYTRTIKHFHFLEWPDFSASVDSTVVIDFIQTVRTHITPEVKGPVLVHCSAGVGRTGTYISIDYLLQYVRDHDLSLSVDIFAWVVQMRKNRVSMVQVDKQYIFIHRALMELIERKRNGLLQSQDDAMISNEIVYENTAFQSDDDDESEEEESDEFYENTLAKVDEQQLTEL